MVDAGFGKSIDRDSDALRWALATDDVVSAAGDWVASPVAGQRAVTLTPGQGQAAQITTPGGNGAKTPQATIALPFDGSMTYQGKLICRELTWLDINADPAGQSGFVVLNGPDTASLPSKPPLASSIQGFKRIPGEKYHMPLWYAVVHQATNTVRLWDLRRVSGEPVPADAVLRTPHWTGKVRTLKNGREVTVVIDVLKGSTYWETGAWNTDIVATGLPPAEALTVLGQISTNQAEYGGWDAEVDEDGVLRFRCRWTTRRFDLGGWARMVGRYISAS